MARLAVFFPGVGYHTDKPLLYYSKKLAKEYGFEIKELSYRDLPENIKGNQEKMAEAFRIASGQVEEQLASIPFSDYETVVFVSKSIGTVIAAAYDQEHKIGAKHVYFTPVPQTFEVVRKASGIVFHGLSDPWCENALVEDACEKQNLKLYVYGDANHSLETGETIKDLNELSQIMKVVSDFIKN